MNQRVGLVVSLRDATISSPILGTFFGESVAKPAAYDGRFFLWWKEVWFFP
jgi:hypothetical protein